MIDCPGPERGVFCISIIDLISRITLVLFSLLHVGKYHYNKEPLKVGIFKSKKIQSRLLRIAVLHPISLRWVIKIVLIYIIARYNCGGTFAAILHWPTMILLFLFFNMLNCHGTLIFLLVSNLFFCGIFKHNFFIAEKNSVNFDFDQQQQVQCRH